MSKINVEEAARDLKDLLKRVAAGEEITLVEHDKPVARIVPPSNRQNLLTKMKEFRSSLSVNGEPLSQTIIKARQEKSYKHERLNELAKSRGMSLNKLMEELSTIALAEFDAETRFKVMVARGNPERGIALLNKLDAHLSLDRGHT